MLRQFLQERYLDRQHMLGDVLNDEFSWFLDQNKAPILHKHRIILEVDKAPYEKNDNQHILFKLT